MKGPVLSWPSGQGLPEPLKISLNRGRQSLYSELVACDFTEDDLTSALAHMELAKSRVLVELMARTPLTPPPVPDDLLQEENRLLSRITELQVERFAATVQGARIHAAGSELTQTQTALDRLWDRIADLDSSGAEYVSLRRGIPLSVEQIRPLLRAAQGPSAVLVEMFLSEDESYLLGYAPEWAEPRGRQSSFTLADARRIAESIRTWLTQGRATGQEIGLDPQDQALLAEFLRPVLAWADPDQPLVIVPHDVLHTVPLHALPPVGGVRLLDRNPVTYVPSAGTLRYCRSRPYPSAGRLLAVTDSDPRRPLPFARAEGVVLGRRHPDTVHLSGGQAVLTRIEAELARGPVAVLHTAVHGVYRPDSPMLSGLALADTTLTAERIMRIRLDGALVNLCACESGAAVPLEGDELLGLIRACLHSGARSVVVGQWSIDDLSTGLLTRYFYEARAAGSGMAAAMRTAQLTLRSTSAQQALDFSSSALVEIGADQAQRREILLGQAEIHLRASNPLGAEAVLAPLRKDRLGRSDDRRFRGALARAGLLRRAGAVPDLEVRLFDEPYFWASYAVVGEWN